VKTATLQARGTLMVMTIDDSGGGGGTSMIAACGQLTPTVVVYRSSS